MLRLVLATSGTEQLVAQTPLPLGSSMPQSAESAVRESESTKPKADFHIAAIAATAALAGSLIGGVFSYVATLKQVEGQSENSQREFLNAQRQGAYSKLLADQAAMGVKQEDIYARAKADPSYTLAAMRSDLEETGLLNSTLSLDATNVEVIGSEAAADLAREIHTSRLDALAAISVLAICYETSQEASIGMRESPCSPTLEVLRESLDSTEREIARLVKAARADLGVAGHVE